MGNIIDFQCIDVQEPKEEIKVEVDEKVEKATQEQEIDDDV